MLLFVLFVVVGLHSLTYHIFSGIHLQVLGLEKLSDVCQFSVGLFQYISFQLEYLHISVSECSIQKEIQTYGFKL